MKWSEKSLSGGFVDVGLDRGQTYWPVLAWVLRRRSKRIWVSQYKLSITYIDFRGRKMGEESWGLHPVVHLVELSRARRETDLVVFVVLGYEILHDGARLEEVDRLAIGEGVCQRGDSAVGVDVEKPLFFLGVLGDVDLLDFVGETVDF